MMGYPTDTKDFVYLFSIYTLIISFSAAVPVTFRAFVAGVEKAKGVYEHYPLLVVDVKYVFE